MQNIIGAMMIDSLFISGGTLTEARAIMLLGKAEQAIKKSIRSEGEIMTLEKYLKKLLDNGGVLESYESDNMHKFNRIHYNRLRAKEQEVYEAKLKKTVQFYGIKTSHNTSAILTQSEYIAAKYLI